MGLRDQAEEVPIPIEAPGTSDLHHLQPCSVVPVDQNGPRPAGRVLVGELDGVGPEPLGRDDGDVLSGDEAPDDGAGGQVLEADQRDDLRLTSTPLFRGFRSTPWALAQGSYNPRSPTGAAPSARCRDGGPLPGSTSTPCARAAASRSIVRRIGPGSRSCSRRSGRTSRTEQAAAGLMMWRPVGSGSSPRVDPSAACGPRAASRRPARWNVAAGALLTI